MKANISHSDNKEFGTPLNVFKKLCNHSNIYPSLDICATESNTKCKKFITKDQDAFKFEWTEDFWANIPFGAKVINPNKTKQLNYGLVAWVKRIHNQTEMYDVSALVLLPLSASILAKFYQYCEVIIIENRITFLNENNQPDKYPISKDLMCLTFRSKQNRIANPYSKKLSAIRI